jgi:hypothetical protein
MKTALKDAFTTIMVVTGMALLIGGGCGGNGFVPDRPSNPTVVLNFTSSFVPIGPNSRGNGTLSNNTTVIPFTITNGQATLKNVAPGSYRVNGRIEGRAFSEPIIVNNEFQQRFQIIKGDFPTLVIEGKIYLNEDDPVTGRCPNPTPASALTERVLVRARNHDTGLIVASLVRERQAANIPDEQKGAFLIHVPEGSYIIEVRQAPAISTTEASAPYTGNSIAFRTPPTTSVTICANEGTVAPNYPPPYSPTPGPSPTPTPGGPPPIPTPTPNVPPPPPFLQKNK